jgi:hypothetical protein
MTIVSDNRKWHLWPVASTIKYDDCKWRSSWLMPVLYMLSGSVNDTTRVSRIMIVGNATTLSSTYDRHYDYSWVVIYNCNMFIMQATVL